MKEFPFKLPMILDGATGVRLSEMGRPKEACPELWTVENPDAIKFIQRGYIEAGSDAVLSATFGGHRHKLTQYGLEDRLEELNAELVRISREAAGEDKLVGGDISAIGLFLKPMGEGNFEDFVKIYREQAEVLDRAGVDFFDIETMMTLAEVRAAIIGIREVSDKPIFVSVTIENNGRMLTGGSPLATMIAVQEMGISAFGLNCSTGPDDMISSIETLAPYAKIPLIIKPNAGVPELIDGKTVYKLPPEEFVKDIDKFASLGVKIYGGCCGTDERYIKALKEKLDTVEFSNVEKAEGDYLSSEREIFKYSDEIEFCDEILASEDLEDDIMDADDDDCEAYQIRIEDREGLEAFCDNQYMINKPLKLVSSDVDLLKSALKCYNGRTISSIDEYGALKI